MFHDLCEEYKFARDLIYQADEILEKKISNIFFCPDKNMSEYENNLQQYIFLCNIVAYEILNKHGTHPDGVSGHSLGEYAALVSSGALSFHDALFLVDRRALFTQEATPADQFAMAALELNAGSSKVLIEKLAPGKIDIANFNCDNQTVVGGFTHDIDNIIDYCIRVLRKKAKKLSIPIASHTRWMKTASDRLKPYIEQTTFISPSIDIYMNVTAACTDNPDKIKENLYHQLYSPVLWQQTVENMYQAGYDTFIECGPGRTLHRLVKKILKGKTVSVSRVEDMATLNETLNNLR